MHVAVIGCGQLSRMLALAGLPLGIQFSFVADSASESTVCVDGLGTICRWLPGQSVPKLYEALGKPDCVTVEKEQVDLSLLQAMEALCPVHPSSVAVGACKHRFQEKQLLNKLDIPTTPFTYQVPIAESIEKLGLPLIVKSCSDGYDGKNQWRLKTVEEAKEFTANSPPNDYIAEQKIAFSKEVSQVSARNTQGEISHYALTENVHVNGILVQSIAPARNIDAKLSTLAQVYMSRVLKELNYVGVLAIEFFVADDQLMVNELAPRVHNSGHWTQTGSISCQFENHIRAISGLALGDTANVGVSGMLNLIGTTAPPRDLLSASSQLFWYNKSVRSGRKLGHMNFVAENHEDLVQKMDPLQDTLKPI